MSNRGLKCIEECENYFFDIVDSFIDCNFNYKNCIQEVSIYKSKYNKLLNIKLLLNAQSLDNSFNILNGLTHSFYLYLLHSNQNEIIFHNYDGYEYIFNSNGNNEFINDDLGCFITIHVSSSDWYYKLVYKDGTEVYFNNNFDNRIFISKIETLKEKYIISFYNNRKIHSISTIDSSINEKIEFTYSSDKIYISVVNISCNNAIINYYEISFNQKYGYDNINIKKYISNSTNYIIDTSIKYIFNGENLIH